MRFLVHRPTISWQQIDYDLCIYPDGREPIELKVVDGLPLLDAASRAALSEAERERT